MCAPSWRAASAEALEIKPRWLARGRFARQFRHVEAALRTELNSACCSALPKDSRHVAELPFLNDRNWPRAQIQTYSR